MLGTRKAPTPLQPPVIDKHHLYHTGAIDTGHLMLSDIGWLKAYAGGRLSGLCCRSQCCWSQQQHGTVLMSFRHGLSSIDGTIQTTSHIQHTVMKAGAAQQGKSDLPTGNQDAANTTWVLCRHGLLPSHPVDLILSHSSSTPSHDGNKYHPS